eukprot:Em0019g1037a
MMDFCYECDEQWHAKGKRKDHHRVSVIQSAKDSKKDSSLCFLLINDREELMVSDTDEFIVKLRCDKTAKIKVVSIFGNTGDGKSHTLNHAFFQEEVFMTSSAQSSCTIGIWVAYSVRHQAIFVDTEGLLGVCENEARRIRLLLKILAISDVVIYRTRAERLHNDLFTFLGDASDAYWKFFMPELQAASAKYKLDIPLSTLGPSVVIFHETQYAHLLGNDALKSREKQILSNMSSSSEVQTMCDEGSSLQPTPRMPGDVQPIGADELLRIRFSELGCIPKSFCSIEYVGTRTQTPPTDFSYFCKAVTDLLKNNAIRSPRQPEVILTALQVLNQKFSGDLEKVQMRALPEAYFSCQQGCLACGARCELSMNHKMDQVPHKITASRCRYHHQYDNKVYLCKACFDSGRESIVDCRIAGSADGSWMGLAKYAWSGSVLECTVCGVIYRSRQHWYGNQSPEIDSVKRENKHVWPEDLLTDTSLSSNTAVTVRKLLDGVSGVAEAITNVGSKPTKMISSWVSDQIAPDYWIPNYKILVCNECKVEFKPSQTKHHCRACGEGFCENCLIKLMPVPWRGWGTVPVKVCNPCHSKHNTKFNESLQMVEIEEAQTHGVTARYVGEVAQKAVSGAMNYSCGIILETARPTYWVPDEEILNCNVCKCDLNLKSKHHCRFCGQGVCDACSHQRKPVPSKGWNYPVRICDTCVKIYDQ